MRLRVAAILVAMVALTAAPTFAQVTGAVKVGANWSKIKFEEDDFSDSSDMKTGLIVGVAVDVPIAPMFSFQPEFLYSQKGGKNGALTDDDPDFEASVKLDMFQIPLLLKVGATEGPFRPFIVAGPAFGFVTSAKTKFEAFGEVEEDDIKDDVETVEISGVIGGGIQFGRGIIEYRYDHGFKNLDKEEGSTAKTRTHSILFGSSVP
jgi:hypothetical protein